ncbi:hypothetical protein SVIOM342S_05005 [Streptomyces violaceorubidus]
MGPDPDAVSGTVGPLDLAAFFETLNTRIARHLDADHQIGHAYLLRDGEPIATEEDLAAAFHHEVIPLLQETTAWAGRTCCTTSSATWSTPSPGVVSMPPQDLADALATEFTSGVTGPDA